MRAMKRLLNFKIVEKLKGVNRALLLLLLFIFSLSNLFTFLKTGLISFCLCVSASQSCFSVLT